MGRIANWFRRRSQRRMRDIFKYFDGNGLVGADPMRIYRDLELHPKFTWELGYAVDAGDADAIGVVTQTVQEVFSINPWDPCTERGLTDAECISVLYEYSTYIEVIKKKLGLGPILSPPTESEHSEEVEDQVSTTKCCSD